MQRTILISGGMGGLGRAIARGFADHGYRVAVLYRHTAKAEVDIFLRSLPGESHLEIPCDLADFVAVEGAVTELASVAGRVDVCVHAAVEPIARKNIADMDAVSFRRQFDVALFGGFNLFKSVADVMKKQRAGAIIGVLSSVLESGGVLGNMPGYVSAKFALRGLLRELAKEVASYGVTVNAVSPGFMETPLNADLARPVTEFFKKKKLLVTPEAVAAVVYDLVDGATVKRTGHIVPVPGGDAFLL